MNFHDPSRTRLGNWRPCWLNSVIALPPIQLEPHESDPSLIHLTICHGSRGVWLEKDIPKTELHKILHFWEVDPEGTFMHLFGLTDWPHEHARIAAAMRPKPKPIEPQVRVPIPIEDLI
jgi:hypothetical protein